MTSPEQRGLFGLVYQCARQHLRWFSSCPVDTQIEVRLIPRLNQSEI